MSKTRKKEKSRKIPCYNKNKKKGRDYEKPFEIPPEYKKLLDPDRILKSTPNLKKLKITLKKDSMKGTSLYATEQIKKNETVAYYKIRVFRYKKYESPTDEVYTFDVYDKEGDDIYKYIGDIDLTSFPKPVNGITFWGPFANEPSVDQEANCRISMNLDANYKNRKKVKVGSSLIYKLVAIKDIEPGEEIMWYYGKDYIRDYEVNDESWSSTSESTYESTSESTTNS